MPPVPKPRKTILTQKSIKMFKQSSEIESEKTDDGSPILSASFNHATNNGVENYSKDIEISDCSSQVTNRTQRLKDREALIGHCEPRVMETEFEYKKPRTRIIENMVCQVDPPISNTATMKKHMSSLEFTEDKF